MLAATVATAQAPALAQPQPSPAVTATTEIAAGDQATRSKDFAGALTHYQAANQAVPSARAEMGVADALYNLGKLGESYETYADVNQTYGPKLGPVEKGLVTKRMKEIAPKTGWLSIRVSEPGAEVDVDGASIGNSPVPALKRVAVGTHAVHVTKAGFQPFDASANVPADDKAVIEATMAPVAQQGHVVVHASGTEPLRVLVDGVDVGATPWEGDLAPGKHTIAGRSSSSTAEAQTVDITAGSKTAVDLVSAATAAHLQIRTNDGKGIIYVDGVVKGEGAFEGDVAPGPHTFVVSREGYERFEKSVTLAERQTDAEAVTLQPMQAVSSGGGEGERAYQGVYGGFGLMGMFGIGGMGTTLETNCSTLGAASCDTPNPLGGGAFGYVGWTWDPVGFELAIAGLFDAANQKATFNASTSVASGVPGGTPARTESFSFLRAGGMAALRARVAYQGRLWRVTGAGGVGFSYREMVMERDATSSTQVSPSKYGPFNEGYYSPALSAEVAFHLRVSPTLALAIGAEFWADSASIGGNNQVPATPTSKPVGVTTQVPIPTPSYTLANGAQVMLGPFLGMQFGP
ncbi:MAG TPA: PEGA domain-containing protein [Polyangiaceae bacterium]